MTRARSVPSVADVDPDVVVVGEDSPSSLDHVGELATAAQLEPVTTSTSGPVVPPAEESDVPPVASTADDAVPADYVADYDDDQTSGIDEDGLDQRIPFT